MTWATFDPRDSPDVQLDVDVDLAQIRAFVLVAERSHFGRAAEQLMVSQQAVSKRVRRLEDVLGDRLLVRTPRGVAPTEAGHRFLPHARLLLATAAAAVGAARHEQRPLRIDGWGSPFGPVRLLDRLARQVTGLDFDTTIRGGLGGVLEALESYRIDLAFGRVVRLAGDWPPTLSHELVLLEGLAIAVSLDHPLADRSVVSPSDLRHSGLWWPIGTGPAEMVDYIRRFADEFDVAVDTRRHSIGPVSPLESLLKNPGRVMAWGLEWPIAEPGVKVIPLNPVPTFPWSMICRKGDRHPVLASVREFLTETGYDDDWLVFDPRRQWLPKIDRVAVGSEA